ncbi:cTAGE family member 15-like [Hippopotamus amphibius kiboko]|uniref:cTAGE family member 15-like n=1 Tax=Hippopotamus amphibius kiboko TaxID=575201 RepID=UPI0025931042|nr:cTAGE family member 15-like [Hippopotamus amphibius kiboko]
MEGLPPAPGATLQLILEHLWGALLVVPESLTRISGLPAFPWEILVCAVVLVLIVRRWHTLRSVMFPRKGSSAHGEVCGKCSENRGPTAQADEALRPPGVEARPPTLQTLCLSAMKADLSRSSFKDTVDFLEKAHNSRPPPLSQVTDGKHTLKASEEDGEQPQKKERKDLHKSIDFPQSPELSDQDIEREKQRVQDKEELGGSLEPSKVRKEQVLKDKLSRLTSTAERLPPTFPSPGPLGDHVDEGNPDVQPKKEAGNGRRPVHGSEVDLKGVPDDADGSVSLPRPEEGRQGTARQLREEKQMIEALTGQITSLQIEEASLQWENSLLDSEIQQLKRKRQCLPDLHDDYVMQLHRKLFKEETRCSELKKKLFNVCKDMNSIYQIRNLSKKIAEDMSKELERTKSYYDQEIRFYEKRAQESWVAAVATERKLMELRKESDRSRQMLAKVESSVQPFPRGPRAAAAPPAAHRGPEVSGGPLGQQPPLPPEGGGSRCEGSGTLGHWQV